MKILHLTFQNLNSLSGTFSIDFGEGPLAEAGIFAITGPTGAGKTTILDAITLALFGKAARYDENKRNNPENMMSRGTGECFSEVRFECGTGVYSARWDLTRARKKPDGRIQGAKRQLADASGDILETKIRQVDEKITELTGMDYPRFLRSVLLAQGRFKEFLDAGVKDRGELLERITGTEIYSELSILAHEAAREKEEAIKGARTAADLIRLLSEEETESLTKERATLDQTKDDTEAELTRLLKRLECHANWNQRSRQKEALATEQREWQARNDDFQPKQKQLDRHNTAAPLAGDLKLWASKNEALSHLDKQLKTLQASHVKARTNTAATFESAITACALQCSAIEARRGEGVKKKETLSTEIATIKEWQKENRTDEPIEQALPSIRQKVDLYRSKVQGFKEAEKAAGLTRQTIDRLEKEITQVDGQLSDAQKTFSHKEEIAKALAREISTLTPKADLGYRKEVAEGKRTVLLDLTRHTESHQAIRAEHESLLAKRTAQQIEIKQLESDIAQLVLTLESERHILTLKEQLHTQATLMASLEEKRSHLIPGQECPLCGATDHPFATQELPKPSETKSSFLAQQSTVAALEKNLQSREKELASTTATLVGIDKQIIAHEKKAAELSSLFSRIAAEQGLEATIGDRARLETLALENTTRLRDIAEQIKAIEALEAKQTSADKECIAARGRTEACAAQLIQLKGALGRAASQLSEQSTHLNTADGDTRAALSTCSAAIAPWDLSADTPEAMASAVETLEKRAMAWRTKGETLAGTLHTETKVDAGLETLAIQITRIKTERDEWALKKEPFSDISPESSKVPEPLLDESARRTLCDKTLQAVSTLETQITATENELSECQKKRSEFHVELSDKLAKRNFESIEALQMALLSEEDHETFLKEKEALATQKIRLQTLTRETDDALSKLAEEKPPTSEEARDLTTRKGDIETERETLLKRMGEINAALAADHKARTDQAAQIAKIETLETEAHPWLVLKDLIGSADGTKFSKFAQGLTLGQLVNLANRHLITLNPRYEIQRVPQEDLELEILDRYQADAVRPTKSLSGGESFLVSLSLALGLSEMAGQKTRIESLFIDEGFGSLDSETLDTALAALENLRLDNRTIGVISHVELLKNRLGTQIEVTRKADGHATLTVVDG
ncbi:nuclease SbcCD subunit C [Desulfoluna limicola]|uniref:Nuclease SbcCD subunit C n=1 Tax=Desulfoluna limicola TaxID=2810562 RepID=A0ABM7PLG6_9BACT|nr:AAA family ATPase [Desulfoluna limicola]BCS98077.1 nuclease SbcCD subunit C [Desulfoluna limicola]